MSINLHEQDLFPYPISSKILINCQWIKEIYNEWLLAG